MFPPKQILFPVDFSDRCTHAARMVETLAGHFEAQLTLLHVVEPLTYNDIPINATAVAEEKLSEYLAEELKHFDVKRVLLHGDPAQNIVEYAHSGTFDLIMLPTHGYGRFRGFILGSVTAKVLHDALCPVWTGVHMEHLPELEDIAIRKLVCAVDLGRQSCPTLRWATAFAAEFGAEVTIVHAIPATRDSGLYADPGPQDAAIVAAAQMMRELQECCGSDTKTSIVFDEVPYAVRQAAACVKADLLVIGRSVEDGMLGRLRTNAYSIIRQSPCPVVSV